MLFLGHSPSTPAMSGMFESSQRCLEDGIQVFGNLGDKLNVALLQGNLGRLLRVFAPCKAFWDTGQSSSEITAQERQFYIKVHVLACLRFNVCS